MVFVCGGLARTYIKIENGPGAGAPGPQPYEVYSAEAGKGFREAKNLPLKCLYVPASAWHNCSLKALSNMTRKYPPKARNLLSPDERKAREIARQADAEQAMREHAAAQEVFHKNRERLKAERLAHEARSRLGDDLILFGLGPSRILDRVT